MQAAAALSSACAQQPVGSRRRTRVRPFLPMFRFSAAAAGLALAAAAEPDRPNMYALASRTPGAVDPSALTWCAPLCAAFPQRRSVGLARRVLRRAAAQRRHYGAVDRARRWEAAPHLDAPVRRLRLGGCRLAQRHDRTGRRAHSGRPGGPHAQPQPDGQGGDRAGSRREFILTLAARPGQAGIPLPPLLPPLAPAPGLTPRVRRAGSMCTSTARQRGAPCSLGATLTT